jgi:tRNA(fMet)-specific endonuclease VapC
MLQYMLDTNICIYIMKNHPPMLADRFNRIAEQLCISSITLGELHYGVEESVLRQQNLDDLTRFTARLETLPFSAEAAVHYGQLRAELERAGRPAGPNDMLIGAHARSEGLIVVTNNTREFSRMPGLRVENWVETQ